MKVSDLRIGNLIYWNIPEKDKVPHMVMGLRETKIQTVPISLGDKIKDYKPIPLTEYWLTEFGFKKRVKEFFFKDNVEIMHRKIFVLSFSRDSDDYFQTIKEIKFVHELQNLYFALTGKELVYDED